MQMGQVSILMMVLDACDKIVQNLTQTGVCTPTPAHVQLGNWDCIHIDALLVILVQ